VLSGCLKSTLGTASVTWSHLGRGFESEVYGILMVIVPQNRMLRNPSRDHVLCGGTYHVLLHTLFRVTGQVFPFLVELTEPQAQRFAKLFKTKPTRISRDLHETHRIRHKTPQHAAAGGCLQCTDFCSVRQFPSRILCGPVGWHDLPAVDPGSRGIWSDRSMVSAREPMPHDGRAAGRPIGAHPGHHAAGPVARSARPSEIGRNRPCWLDGHRGSRSRLSHHTRVQDSLLIPMPREPSATALRNILVGARLDGNGERNIATAGFCGKKGPRSASRRSSWRVPHLRAAEVIVYILEQVHEHKEEPPPKFCGQGGGGVGESTRIGNPGPDRCPRSR